MAAEESPGVGQEAKEGRWCNCSCKAVAKFCLLYYITLAMVVMLFTAVNQETLTRNELIWFWAYLVTLFFTLSLAVTALAILLFTDYYGVDTGAEAIAAATYGNKEPSAGNDENSASFKTVLTINSSLPEKSEPVAAPGANNPAMAAAASLMTLMPLPQPDTTGFVNLTPSVKSPVTLVDMKRGKLDRRLGKKTVKTMRDQPLNATTKTVTKEDPAKMAAETNLAAIPSDVLTKDKSKDRTNHGARGAKNKKKPKVKKKPVS